MDLCNRRVNLLRGLHRNRRQHLGVVAALFSSLLSLSAANLNPEGLWKTTDDRTGRPKGIVRIYQDKGLYFGRVVEALNPEEAKQTCTLCADNRRNQPVVGMVVISGMRKDGNEYNGGEILDPDSGTVYRCKFRMEDQGQRLIVRGFIGFALFGRSQTWIRQP